MKHALLFSAATVALSFSAAAVATSLRDELLAIPVTPALGGDTTRPIATPEAFTFAAENIKPMNRPMFAFGNQMFTAEWTPAPGPQPTTDGLGPMFNRESCVACHVQNGRGKAPDGPNDLMDTMLMRWSVPGEAEHGAPKPVPGYGDQLQDRALDGLKPEGRARVTWSEVKGAYADGTPYTLRTPSFKYTDLAYGNLPKDIMSSPRVANPMVGLGLLESVPASTLEALADPDDKDGDGISGRINTVWDAPSQSLKPGRFGWKANVASLSHQNAGAARGDMGISTPVFVADVCEQGQAKCFEYAKKADQGIEMEDSFFERLNIYMHLLAVPQQRGADRPEVKRGEVLFRGAGCASCHMPTLKTDDTAPFAELKNQTFHPFTDLLLHDMGEALNDNRPDFMASGSEWRTAPLWGIGLTQTVNGHTHFLHDGRARNIAEAILWHGGEAEAAKEKFRSMPKAERDDLLAFLNSL
ncbi:MAG: c-type cytochrome [Rhodospirillaceae bacterium]|nr:c-type cytochrome [Rhodospirillaceae bacterium]